MKKFIISTVSIACLFSAFNVYAAKPVKSSKTSSTPIISTVLTDEQKSAIADAAKNVTIDNKIEVSYLCGPKNKGPLDAMYGIKGNDVVVAQVYLEGGLSPILYRDPTVMDANVFISQEGISWTTQLADAKTVAQVNAIALKQPNEIKNKNGKNEIIQQIVTDNCIIDKSVKAPTATN